MAKRKTKKTSLFKTAAEAKADMQKQIMKLVFAGVTNTAYDFAVSKISEQVNNDLFNKIFVGSSNAVKSAAGAYLTIYAKDPNLEAVGLSLFAGGASGFVKNALGLSGLQASEAETQNQPIALPANTEDLEALIEQFDRQLEQSSQAESVSVSNPSYVDSNAFFQNI